MLRATAGYICTHNFFGGAYVDFYLIYALNLFSENILSFSVLVALGGAGALSGSFCSGYVHAVSVMGEHWLARPCSLARSPSAHHWLSGRYPWFSR